MPSLIGMPQVASHHPREKYPSWRHCLKKALEWKESLKIQKGRKSGRPKIRSKALLSPKMALKDFKKTSEPSKPLTDTPMASELYGEELSPFGKLVTRNTSICDPTFLSEHRFREPKIETLEPLIYEEGYTIDDIAKLLRISRTNYAVKIITNRGRGENTELLRIRVDYAMAIMTTRRGVTLEEIAEVLKIPTDKWFVHFPPTSPGLGPLHFDCTIFESTARFMPPSETEEDDAFSPWIHSVFIISQNKSAPTRAQCTFDTGNYQGNIVSRAFLLDVLGYSESTFEPLVRDEQLGGIDASGRKLLPLGAVNLSWYAGRSTRIFRDVRFLVSPHPHYDLIIGAEFIEKYSLLGAPNFMIAKQRPEISGRKSSDNHSRHLLTESLRSVESKNPDQCHEKPMFSSNESFEDGVIYEKPRVVELRRPRVHQGAKEHTAAYIEDVSARVKTYDASGDEDDDGVTAVSTAQSTFLVDDVSTTTPADVHSESILPIVSESATNSKIPLLCNEDVLESNTESILLKAELSNEVLQQQAPIKPLECSSPSGGLISASDKAPFFSREISHNSSSSKPLDASSSRDNFESSKERAAITSAINKITNNLTSFAFSYLKSQVEHQFTQCMGKNEGSSSGNSRKENLDRKNNGKQRDNGKRRRTSKSGAYENGGNEGDEEGDGDDDDSREEDKNGLNRPLPGGWGCIFHIQYPDWYHPQNLCLNPKSRQKFNLCATKSFRRLDELINHIIDVHQLPEFVCIRCRAEFSSQEQHYDHFLSCQRQPFRNIKFGIDQNMRHKLSSLPKKPRDQTFLERWRVVFDIIFPEETTPPSPYFEEGAKRFGKYNVYLKDNIPNLARRYLEKATNEMKLEAELRQYVQDVLDRLIEDSFPEILRDASEGFRALEIAGRPVPHSAPPLRPLEPTSKSSPLSDSWDQLMVPDVLKTPPDMSFAEVTTPTFPVPYAETERLNEFDFDQEHCQAPSSMVENPCSHYGSITFDSQQERQPPSFGENPPNIPLDFVTSETAIFDSHTGWQGIYFGDRFELGEWEDECSPYQDRGKILK